MFHTLTATIFTNRSEPGIFTAHQQGSGVLRASVCLSVCLSAIISSELHVRLLVRVTHGRGSILLWWRSDKLCTSGFMDDVMFAHKPLRLLDVAAQLKRSADAALGLAINCAQ